MNNNYEWLILTSADEGYPMRILDGGFICRKGIFFLSPLYNKI